jgi:FkbM family methyltransferase
VTFSIATSEVLSDDWKPVKQLMQLCLRQFGYQIRDIRKIGCDAWRDLEIILAEVPAPVCFDIGAHEGETSLSMLEHFPGATIYAFEPDPENFKALQNALQTAPRTKIFPMAMGDCPQRAKFLRTDYSQTHSLLPSVANKKTGEIEVRVLTVDEFCLEHKIESIDLLKTDCQGFDLRVLKGAGKMLSEGRVKAIFCECLYGKEYEGQGWFYEVFGFLTEMNYAPVTIYNPVRNEFNEAHAGDAVFKRKALRHA